MSTDDNTCFKPMTFFRSQLTEPFYVDGCDHGIEKWRGTIVEWSPVKFASKFYDVYAYTGGLDTIDLCIRYGSEAHEYISPGPLGKVIADVVNRQPLPETYYAAVDLCAGTLGFINGEAHRMAQFTANHMNSIAHLLSISLETGELSEHAHHCLVRRFVNLFSSNPRFMPDKFREMSRQANQQKEDERRERILQDSER